MEAAAVEVDVHDVGRPGGAEVDRAGEDLAGEGEQAHGRRVPGATSGRARHAGPRHAGPSGATTRPRHAGSVRPPGRGPSFRYSCTAARPRRSALRSRCPGDTAVALPSLSRIPAPPDPILGLAEAFRNDPRPGKINLSSGVFVDETGTTPVLPTVTEAERRILAKGATKLYRPIDGDAAYRAAVQAYVFGEGHELATSGRVAVSQTPGGTGGLRVAADFLRQAGAPATIWMSEPTWPNHPQLFQLAGFRIRTYPYTDPSGPADRRGGAPGRAGRGVARRHRPAPRLVPQPDRRRPLARPLARDRRPRRGAPPAAPRRLRLPGLRRRDPRGRRLDGGADPARRRAPGLDLVLQELRPLQRAGRRAAGRRPLGEGRRGGPEQREDRDPLELLEPARRTGPTS